MLSLLIVLCVLVIVCWIISIIPLPASRFPVKNILYAIVGLIAIVYLLRFAGLV